MGLGRLGDLPLRKAGRPTVSRGFVLAGGVGLSGAGIGDAPAAGGLLRSCGCGGLVGGGCPRACVWGWHAVGVLG